MEMPELKEGEILAETLYTAICGSDLSATLSKSNFDWIQRPRVIGHETCAKVLKLGPGNHGSLKPGDLFIPVAQLGCKKTIASARRNLETTPSRGEFYFIYNYEAIEYKDDFYIVELKNNIISEKELLDEYYVKLKFPSYFGFNWDALWDCLSYLENIKQTNIVIYHQELPKLEEKDLRIYLKILCDTVSLWKKYKEHNFDVYFRMEDYDTVQQITAK